MKLRDANLHVYEKKTPFTHPPSFILPSFSQNTSRLLLSKRFWKCGSTISFRKYKRKVVLLVIYLFNYDSSKSAFFMLNMAIDVLLSTVHSFCQIWNSSFLAIQNYKTILPFALYFEAYRKSGTRDPGPGTLSETFTSLY